MDTLSISGKEIRTAEELQLLGVTIDSQMDFNNHISALCKRVKSEDWRVDEVEEPHSNNSKAPSF